MTPACAFPVPVDDVTVRQTHISVVFLGGDLVYKVKKPSLQAVRVAKSVAGGVTRM